MPTPPINFDDQLRYLQLHSILENYPHVLAKTAEKSRSFHDALEELVAGEVQRRFQKSVEYRLKNARFPLVKTREQFNWLHPKKINRDHILSLFRLDFLAAHTNIIFLGGVGVGKTHLAIALAYHACQQAYSVLFATAIEIVNHLSAALRAHDFAAALRTYRAPQLLVIDELGYIPIDKQGADLLFQVISQRYEHGSIVLTTNRAFKDWPAIFNQDSVMTSALLDRLHHHCEVVVIEGPSYRMKDHPQK